MRPIPARPTPDSSREVLVTRSHKPRWRRARGLAALAIPLALAAGVLPASGTAAAEPTAPTPATASATIRTGTAESTGTTGSADQHQAQALSLPGLHDDSYSVTLITGDQVQLTAAGGDHYSVTATPGAGGGESVLVRGQGGVDGVDALQAIPSSAQFLIASGKVDGGLFDVRYLATHGYTDDAGQALAVTVRYNGHPDDATITRHASDLPASKLVAADARTATAQVAVDPRHVADFWAALTGTPNTSPQGSGPFGLADGIDRVWLTGHETSTSQAQPDSGEPVYTVTLTVTLRPGELDSQVFSCGGPVTVCVATGVLAGVTDNGEILGRTAALRCVDRDPCTTRVANFAVPAGTYMAEVPPSAWFVSHFQNQTILAVAPQITVTRDTAVSIDLAKLRQVTVDTPKASETFNAVLQRQRTFNGFNFWEFLTGGYYRYWVLPTDQPVSVGAFHISTAWMLGRSPVTMDVDQAPNLRLHPRYPNYTFIPTQEPFVRFTGRQRLEVVDAGYGRPEDFAGIDAHGKLALMRVIHGDCTPGNIATVTESQLHNALQAGAAGVLVDPRNLVKNPDGGCDLPVLYFGSTPRPQIPFIAVPATEAIQLEELLGHGTVSVTLTDHGESPYVYNLKFYEEGRVPSSQHHEVNPDELTTATIDYHTDSAEPGSAEMTLGAFRPDENVIGGTFNDLVTPASRTEYFGPVSPDLVYTPFVRIWHGDKIYSQDSVDLFDQRRGTQSEHVDARPVSPGAPRVDPDVLQAQPGRWEGVSGATCALCRQGNALVPIAYLVRGNQPMQEALRFGPKAMHLYLGDKEIPQTTVSGHPVYEMPSERHTYRLVADYDNRDFGNTHADWTFSSAAPEHDQTPSGRVCDLARHRVSDEPCQADPLVFLSYDLDVALDSTLAAPSVPRLTVTAYHQAADAAAIQDLKVWTSTDDGQHWKPALVLPHGRGEHGARDFSVITAVPPLNQTTGTLSIKAQATDTDGNSITQTLTQAVRLTQGTEWGWPGHRVWQ